MKKLAIIAVSLLGALSAMAQGRFINENGGSSVNGVVNAPVTDVDGVTKASGPSYSAQAYIAAAGSGNYTAVGAPVPFDINIPGYFYGGTTITTLTGDASVLIRVYQTALGSYQTAASTAGAKIGSFAPVTVTLSTGTSPDPVLLGLAPITLTTVVVPEPSTIALGVVGAAALLLRRRRA